MIRPSHTVTIDALRTTDPRFPWVHPAEEEAVVADVLELVQAEHQGDTDAPDDTGHWGTCITCGTSWPCERWVWSQHLAVQFLGRAADRVWARAKKVMDRLDAASSDACEGTGPVFTSRARRPDADVANAHERERLRELRAVPVTPVYCTHNGCRVVVSVVHPLPADWATATRCPAHPLNPEEAA